MMLQTLFRSELVRFFRSRLIERADVPLSERRFPDSERSFFVVSLITTLAPYPGLRVGDQLAPTTRHEASRYDEGLLVSVRVTTSFCTVAMVNQQTAWEAPPLEKALT